MRSKSFSAALFGLIFAIIFSCVALVTPSTERYECGGKISREIMLFGIEPLTIPIGNTDGCAGGTLIKSVGIPRATKKATITAQPPQPGFAIDNSLKFQAGGFFVNVLIYWALGFIFFMVFATRRKPKMNKHGEVIG